MNIQLAGFNIEKDIMDSLDLENREILTPEIFSSAYARISRSSKDVPALRRQARKDITRARKSNQAIIFEMGHHSVAEHAVFNFDLTGVSRLALEEIEKFRLASYTEKSQRYVTLNGDFVLPGEIKDNETQEVFKKTIQLQNDFYKKSLKLLIEAVVKEHPEKAEDKQELRELHNLAKEDARYILSLATEGQLGMTMNARNLEHLFRRFNMSHREEVREIGRTMFDLAYKVAPSIFLFPEPSQFEKELDSQFNNLFPVKVHQPSRDIGVNIIHYSDNADFIILAALLAGHNKLSFPESLDLVKKLEKKKIEKLYRNLFEYMAFFDAPPREFELADITFQAVVSASNFAQLKRHRMATLLTGEYELVFGNTIPESIRENGLETEFNHIIAQTDKVYDVIKDRYGCAADYILTNSHRKRVTMKMNLRELYHFARLRQDEHAQWDIRDLANDVVDKVKGIMPYSTMLLCGKSDFTQEFENIYGKKPAIII